MRRPLCNLVDFSAGGVLESSGVCLSLFNCSDDGGNLCERCILALPEYFQPGLIIVGPEDEMLSKGSLFSRTGVVIEIALHATS